MNEIFDSLYICSIDGKLVSSADGRPFQYNMYRNDDENRKRYSAIGRSVTTYIYDLLVRDCGLIKIPIPVCR